MPRTNQGVFNKIKTDYNGLVADYVCYQEQNFKDGEYNCNRDFFSDFAYDADGVFRKCNNTINSLQGLLQTTKFEMADKENEYRNMLASAESMRSEIASEFSSLLSNFNGDISDVEQRTLDKLDVYHNR